MVQRPNYWVILLCLLLAITASIEGVFLYLLKAQNTILLQWLAVALTDLQEANEAIAICKEAREMCRSMRAL